MAGGAQPRAERGPIPMRSQRYEVLVADDSPAARDTVRSLLARDPYTLHTVDCGASALRALGSQVLDLVICDVVMPRIGGFELARIMKSHAEWRFVPVMLVSVLDGQDDMVRGLEAGADDFLVKPLDRVVLRARIRALLRIREQYGALRDAVVPDVETLVVQRRERIITSANLTGREREVLDLVLLGRSHDEIAAALGISARTSKFHQARVLEKLGADSRTDLTRLFA
jgi:DNA-binding NarL/FixJ family response regulator